MAEKVELADMINTFLKERRESDGGWAPVTEKDIDQLHEILGTLLTAKWGEDPDGDLPISVRVVDRTREHVPFFFPIPYDDALKAFDYTITNLAIATEQVEKYIRMARFDCAEGAAQKHAIEKRIGG